MKQRQYLVCAPQYFDVIYSINPWMSSQEPVDRGLAQKQWKALVSVFDDLGHRVHRVLPAADLPDMVFSANAAMVLDGKVLGASFHHPERQPEAAHYRTWFEYAGFDVQASAWTSEGEGDFVWVAGKLLAGTGFRTQPQAHREAAEFFGKPTVSLTLVDPRFYHLDTALFALDDNNVAYYPGAFSASSQKALADLFPEAIIATREDAMSFGLNSVSDGRHVVIADRATGLIHAITDRGYIPIPIDMSELRKAGGGAKCCTLEIRP
ncbi:dimethylargininase [Streptomyces fildesensis]|uniref:Dimethylargininase n=1 Tax=Streptomyces fildesensis TaxID=375757 RepID=A0ABW8CG65_9ACTN